MSEAEKYYTRPENYSKYVKLSALATDELDLIFQLATDFSTQQNKELREKLTVREFWLRSMWKNFGTFCESINLKQ